MAAKTVKKETVFQKMDQVKSKIKTLNHDTLHVSDDLLTATLSTAGKWQKVMAKALTVGTDLFGKQQDLVLTTLEGVKGHYTSGNRRVKKLLGFETPKSKKAGRPTIHKVVLKKTEKKATNGASKSDTAKDDLKIIDGIGPKIESLLNQAGISTFEHLIATDLKDLKAILEKAGSRFKMHNPTTWKEKAKSVARGKMAK